MAKKVAIVGGGPVGLICALGLAKEGIDVTVIEAEAGVVESPRAMGYHWPVLDGLDLLGVLDDMKAEGFTLQDFTFRIFSTGEQIAYNSAVLEGTTDFPHMLVLGQNKLAKIVLRHVERHANVEILWSTSVTSLSQDAEKVTLNADRDGEPLTIEADWVIAADGGRSAVRKAVGLGFEGFTWPNRFVATNIRYDLDEHGWGRMGFLVDPEFGGVIGKLDKDGLWRVTFSEDAQLPIESLEERIHAYLRRILPGDGKFDLTLYSGYGMHQRSAERYRVGRVLLAGDAAHVTNPTSGYGLVGGLFDAFALTDALAAVVKGEADPALLDSYAEARHKIYHEITNPVSSKSLRLVFHSNDPSKLRQVIDDIRARSAQPDAVFDWYQTPSRLETPSLVTGLTTREKRAQRLADPSQAA